MEPFKIPPIDLPVIKGASQILDRLYLGDYYDAIDPVQMKALKITHIVNMTPESNAAKIDGIEYLYVDIQDIPSEYKKMQETLVNIVPKIHQVLSIPGTVVLIHCAYGMSRSASLTVGYVMYSQKMSFYRAMNHVNSLRWIALPNVGFLYALKKYDDYLRKTFV